VDRSITAEKMIDVLVELFCTRSVPKHICSDNCPELIAKVIRQLRRTGNFVRGSKTRDCENIAARNDRE
jgi:hypothetical protein